MYPTTGTNLARSMMTRAEQRRQIHLAELAAAKRVDAAVSASPTRSARRLALRFSLPDARPRPEG